MFAITGATQSQFYLPFFSTAQPEPTIVDKLKDVFAKGLDWIKATEKPIPPSLLDRVISLLQTLRSMITGYKAPEESHVKKNLQRLCTVAKRVAIVVGITIAASIVCDALGMGLQKWGTLLVTNAGESWGVMMASGKTVQVLGYALSMGSSGVLTTVTQPIFLLLKGPAALWTTSTTLVSVVKPVFLALGDMAMFGIGLGGKVLGWVVSQIISSVWGGISLVVSPVYNITSWSLTSAFPYVASLVLPDFKSMFSFASLIPSSETNNPIPLSESVAEDGGGALYNIYTIFAATLKGLANLT